MQRARRLASIAVIAALAVGGLTACRSQPGAAAYVGDRMIPESRVDAVLDDARTKLDAAVQQFRDEQAAQPGASPLPSPEPVELPIDREQVVQTLVGRELLRSVGETRGLRPSEISPEQAQQEAGLPANTEYVQAFAEFRGYLDAFAQTVQPAEVTEDDLRDVYDRLRRGGALGPEGGSFAEFQANLGEQDRETLAQNIGLRNELTAEVERLDAAVNPRYAGAALPLVTFRNAQGEETALVLISFDARSGVPVIES